MNNNNQKEEIMKTAAQLWVEEGRQEGREEVARNLLFKLHLDLDTVQKATNLPKEELQKIILN